MDWANSIVGDPIKLQQPNQVQTQIHPKIFGKYLLYKLFILF